MLRCWSDRPEERPKFAEVRELLDGTLEQITFGNPDLMVKIVVVTV